jgi:copper resistance protein B
LRGTAPYGVNVEGTFYLGDQGRTAARFKIEYDALLTQRWILQPEAEAELYGKSDAGREIGSALANLDLGLRLRYEIRREIAPYLGVAWTRRRGPGADTNDVQFVAGIRAWY